MDGLTAQEVFDTVVNHFKTQKVPAVTGRRCLYRTPDGLKCAAGILIKDEDYSPDMEGTDFSGIASDLPYLYDHVDLIQRLQDVHDSVGVELLTTFTRNKLKEVAEEYSLNDSLVDW